MTNLRCVENVTQNQGVELVDTTALSTRLNLTKIARNQGAEFVGTTALSAWLAFNDFQTPKLSR